MLNTQAIPHTEGADLIRSKPAVTRALFDRLPIDLRGRAMMVTGLESLDAVANVRDLAASLSEGGDYDEIKDQILAELSPWLVTSDDPDDRLAEMQAATRRAEMLLRMHGWQSYAATNHASLIDNIDVFPYHQYLSSGDSKVRHSHEILDQRILPADDPFWDNHTPPWEFGCRCDKVGLTREEVEEMQAEDADLPPERRRVMSQDDLDLLAREQVVLDRDGRGQKIDVRTPYEKDGEGYEWRAGDAGMPMEQILARYSPTDREAFAAWARGIALEDGLSLWAWASGEPAAPNKPVRAAVTSALGPAVSAALVNTLGGAGKRRVQEALDAIDRTHGDGVLPKIPIKLSRSKKFLGYFQRTATRAHQIGIVPRGSHPGLTTAHEIGHFLDFSALGEARQYASEGSGPIGQLVARIAQGATVESIPDFEKSAYYRSRVEIWARAYAQFIAEESGEPELVRGVKDIRAGQAPWRQWPEEEFASYRTEMREIFRNQKWMK